MGFKQNSWYVIALSSELRHGALLERVVLGVKVVIYRRQSGEAAVIDGICPHRFAPLAMGKQIGDSIQCGYHGLQFGPDGRCAHNPRGDGHLNARLNLKSYPVVERDRFIWVWMGAAEFADPSLIANYEELGNAPDNLVAEGYLFSRCHYELITDNLLDASHADYVHLSSLHTHGLFDTVPAVEHKNESIAAVFESDSFIVSPFFAPFVRDPNKAVSQRHMFRWDPPSSVWIAGDIDQEGSPHLQLRALHALTPETETSTHYWFCAARNFADNGPAGKTAASEAAMRIFATEDKPMLEGVQACMGGREFWDMNPAILQGDNVAVLARRSLRKMIQAEQKDSPCPAP